MEAEGGRRRRSRASDRWLVLMQRERSGAYTDFTRVEEPREHDEFGVRADEIEGQFSLEYDEIVIGSGAREWGCRSEIF